MWFANAATGPVLWLLWSQASCRGARLQRLLLLSLPAFRWHYSIQLKACAWQSWLLTALSAALPAPWDKAFIPLPVALAAEMSSPCTFIRLKERTIWVLGTFAVQVQNSQRCKWQDLTESISQAGQDMVPWQWCRLASTLTQRPLN